MRPATRRKDGDREGLDAGLMSCSVHVLFGCVRRFDMPHISRVFLMLLKVFNALKPWNTGTSEPVLLGLGAGIARG